MTYLIDTWYVEYPDGTLSPCQNYRTAEYIVANTEAIRIVDVTKELLTK